MMRKNGGFVRGAAISLGIVMTLALSVAAVVIAADPRAAGVVVMIVGAAVGGVLGVREYRAASDAGRAAVTPVVTGKPPFRKAA
jgi:hypothetical protein